MKTGAAVASLQLLWNTVSAGLEERRYNNEKNVHVSCGQLELDFKLTQLCQVVPIYPIVWSIIHAPHLSLVKAAMMYIVCEVCVSPWARRIASAVGTSATGF